MNSSIKLLSQIFKILKKIIFLKKVFELKKAEYVCERARLGVYVNKIQVDILKNNQRIDLIDYICHIDQLIELRWVHIIEENL